MGYDDRNDPTWRAINRDYDRKKDRQISDLRWKIEKSHIDSRRLDDEIDYLRSKTDRSEALDDSYERETHRLRHLSYDGLRSQFRRDCDYLARWIEESRCFPAETRERFPKFLRGLHIANKETWNMLEDTKKEIDREKKRVENNSALHNYLMELYDCWQGVHYLGRIADAWNWKLAEAKE